MSSKRESFFKHHLNRLDDVINLRQKKSLTLRKQNLEEIILNKRFLRQVDLYIDEDFSKDITKENTNENIKDKNQNFINNKKNDDNHYLDFDNFSDFYTQIQRDYISKDFFADYCNKVCSEDPREIIRGLVGIRKCLADPANPPISEVTTNGVGVKLIELLKTDFGNQNLIAFEILWILVNIASGEEEHTEFLLNNGVIEIIKSKILTVSSSHVVDQIIWLIANLSADETHRKHITPSFYSFLNFLVRILLDSNFEKYIPHCLWAITNLIRGSRDIPYNSDTAAIINYSSLIIKKFTQITNDSKCKWRKDDVLPYAVMCICYLTEFNSDLLNTLVESDVTEVLVDMVDEYINEDEHSRCLLLTILRIFGNMSAGDAKSTCEIVNNGVLPKLKQVIDTDSRSYVRKECCWILSNIAAGLQLHISLFFVNDGYLDLLFDVARNDKQDVKKEALWCLANLTSTNNPSHIMELIAKEMLPLISDFINHNDYKICAICLEALENILHFAKSSSSPSLRTRVFMECEQYGIITKVDSLTENENNVISEKSSKLYTRYFIETYECRTTPESNIIFSSDISPFEIHNHNNNNHALDIDFSNTNTDNYEDKLNMNISSNNNSELINCEVNENEDSNTASPPMNPITQLNPMADIDI